MSAPTRVVIALGGNAMTGPDGSATPGAQRDAIAVAARHIAAVEARGLPRRTAALVTRTLVAVDDPGFREPTKPIGRFLPAEDARRLIALGQTWEDRGDRGRPACARFPHRHHVLEHIADAVHGDVGTVLTA